MNPKITLYQPFRRIVAEKERGCEIPMHQVGPPLGEGVLEGQIFS
jgi:hypothetical protein